MVLNKKSRFAGIQALSCLPVLLAGLTPGQALAATDDSAVAMAAESTSLMPPARSGECYGKVQVPAQYKTESIDVITKQATNSFAITGPKFKDSSKRVLIKDAYTKLEAVQAVVEEVNDVFEVSPASKRWVRGGLESAIPMTAGDKSDLAEAGVNLTDIDPGTCMYEHYKAPATVTVAEQVLISQASEKIEVQEATFRKGTENVLIKSAFNRLIEVPAVFKEVEDRVLVEPATSVWKKGTGPIQRINNLTGEIMCRVDVPAVYESIKKQVVGTAPLVTKVAQAAQYKLINIEKLVVDAKEIRTPVPAVYKTMNKKRVEGEGSFSWLDRESNVAANGEPTGRVLCNQAIPAETIAYKRKVVTTPGRVVKTTEDPKYREVSVVELVQDSSSKSVPIPAVSSKYEKRTKVSDARFEWQPILCETNVTNAVVTRLQQSLKDNGYSVGSIDGVLGKGTFRAIERYQSDKNLSRGGITLETIKSLGVSL